MEGVESRWSQGSSACGNMAEDSRSVGREWLIGVERAESGAAWRELGLWGWRCVAGAVWLWGWRCKDGMAMLCCSDAVRMLYASCSATRMAAISPLDAATRRLLSD